MPGNHGYEGAVLWDSAQHVVENVVAGTPQKCLCLRNDRHRTLASDCACGCIDGSKLPL
jgi:hypothetical protein